MLFLNVNTLFCLLGEDKTKNVFNPLWGLTTSRGPILNRQEFWNPCISNVGENIFKMEVGLTVQILSARRELQKDNVKKTLLKCYYPILNVF